MIIKFTLNCNEKEGKAFPIFQAFLGGCTYIVVYANCDENVCKIIFLTLNSCDAKCMSCCLEFLKQEMFNQILDLELENCISLI